MKKQEADSKTGHLITPYTGIITVVISVDTTNMFLREIESRSIPFVAADFEAYISATRRPSLGSGIMKARICFAFIDFDKDANEATRSTQYLKQIFGDRVHVVALSTRSDPGSILVAMRSGCSEYLAKPVIKEELDKVLNRLEQQIEQHESQTQKASSLLTLLGAKGGVGTTTLAVHLATYLAQCHGKKTLLIDQHAQLGHVCMYLGIDGSNYTFEEVVRNIARLDSELLHGVVARHRTNVDVISSSDVISEIRQMEPEAIARAIEFLRTEYDYIVVDAEARHEALLRPFLEASSCVYLVGTPDIGSIRDLARYVDKLILSDAIEKKLQVVINRVNLPAAITIDQIEKAMKFDVAIRVENSAELVRSENLGEPLAVDACVPFVESITRWTEKLVGQPSRIVATKKETKLFLWRLSAPVH